jgi:hypothetical protein
VFFVELRVANLKSSCCSIIIEIKRKRNEKSSEMKCSEGFNVVLVAMKASKASRLTSP